MQRGNISIFATFGSHLGFLRKMKSVNISKTVRDRAISREFLIRRVLQQCRMQRGKISRVSYAKGKKFQFSPLLAAILDFSGK